MRAALRRKRWSRWTSAQDALLLTGNMAEIARALGTSRQAVASRRQVLGLGPTAHGRAMNYAADVRDDVMRAIAAGERSARAIAEDFGISTRAVTRYRRAMRAYGLRVLVPTGTGDRYDPTTQRHSEAA